MDKRLFLFLFALLFISTVSAVPPVLSTIQSGSLEIIAPTYEVVKAGVDKDIYWHVLNVSTYLTNQTVNCTYHLYEQNKKGEHVVSILQVKGHSNDRDFEVEVKGANFTNGRYCQLIECKTASQTGAIERCFEVTPNGTILGTVEISVYLFFLILCLVLTFFSGWLATNNTFEKDKVDYQSMYEEKKRNEAVFYLNLLKRKMWIAGVFGVYLSVFIFMAISTQLVYNLQLMDMFEILNNVTIIMMWCLIPFVGFWIVYVILFLYKSVEAAMAYQFGVGERNRGKYNA